MGIICSIGFISIMLFWIIHLSTNNKNYCQHYHTDFLILYIQMTSYYVSNAEYKLINVFTIIIQNCYLGHIHPIT